MSELTESERLLLAREIAADTSGYRNCRDAFEAGWDAAMNYIKERDDKTKLVESQRAG